MLFREEYVFLVGFDGVGLTAAAVVGEESCHVVAFAKLVDYEVAVDWRLEVGIHLVAREELVVFVLQAGAVAQDVCFNGCSLVEHLAGFKFHTSSDDSQLSGWVDFAGDYGFAHVAEPLAFHFVHSELEE